MRKFFGRFVLGSVAAFALSLSAQATVYNGNGGTGFGGPVGNGVLTLTSDGTNLYGTINQGNLPTGFNDTLVIYIDDKAGGFNTTSTFADTGGGGDALRQAISGYNGTSRATLNFATGFGADYAIALSPSQGQFGAFYTLDNISGFTYGSNGSNGNANLSPTGPASSGGNTASAYTFSIPLAAIGSPRSFTFSTTYLDGVGITRSNEAFGNTIMDVTTPANTGNLNQDTGLVSFSTFLVPEPGTWVILLAGLSVLIGLQYRRHQT